MIAFAAIQAVALLQLTVCGWLLPAWFNPARPFGVPVPDAALADAVLRRYRAIVVAAGYAVTALSVGATWHATVTATASAMSGAIATLFLVGWLAYCHARGTLNRHAANLPRHADDAAAASPVEDRRGIPVRWVFPVVALLALTVVIGAARFHDLPPSLAIRWTAGLADRQAPATMEAAASLIAPQLLLALTTLAAIGFAWSTGAGQGRASSGRTCRALMALCTGAQASLLTGSLILWGLLPAPPV